MGDNDIKVVKYVLFGLVASVALLIGNCQGTKYQVRKALESGNVTAIEANCALTDYCDDTAIIAEILAESR